MTVSSSSNKVLYAGNGIATVFAFTFPIHAESDLRVVLRASNGTETVKALTTHYTVSASPWTTGGSVTMLTPPASGETLLIKREVDVTQGLDLVDGDALPAESLERALDKLTFILQQLSEVSERVVTLQEATALSSLVLPDPASGEILYSPDGVTLDWATLGTLSGTPLMTPIPIADGGTGANSAAGARTALGVLPIGGGTMTGTLTLAGPPSAALDAATKAYADSLVTNMGYLNVPQNSQSVNYTLVLGDQGKHLLHPAADANARTFTIPANASVPYQIGTTLTFVNETANVLSIAITTDTLVLAGTTTTGTRSLAQNGVATAIKVTSTKWIISGSGLT